jgi:hypothetical protein
MINLNNGCVNAQNDNVYLKTSIVNNSVTVGAIPAQYRDNRIQDILSDSCSYEICMNQLVIPRGILPIKIIDPLLTLGSIDWINMPEAIRIIVSDGSNDYTATRNLRWETEIDIELYPDSKNPNGTPITQEIIDDISYFTRYTQYYSLYTIEHFVSILNKTFKLLDDDINANTTVPITTSSPIICSYNANSNSIGIHLSEEYMYSSIVPPPVFVNIQMNNRLALLFNQAIPFKYGRLRTTNPDERWNTINNDKFGQEWITKYDVSDFVAPYDNCIYTFGVGNSILHNFHTFGGFNRIEVRTNLPLNKKVYTQRQNTTTGEIKELESEEVNIFFTLSLNYNRNLQEDIRIQTNYPFWNSIIKYGGLREISYDIITVDNLGNVRPLFLQFGNQINMDLYLRKVF